MCIRDSSKADSVKNQRILSQIQNIHGIEPVQHLLKMKHNIKSKADQVATSQPAAVFQHPDADIIAPKPLIRAGKFLSLTFFI